MRSIRRYLLTGMFSAVLLAVLVSTVVSYMATSEEVEEIYDAQLAEYARFIEGFLSHARATPDWLQINRALGQAASLRIPAGSEYGPDGHAYERKLAIQIVDGHGRLLVTSPSAPPWPLSPLRKGFFEQRFAGYNWYVYTHRGPASRYWLIVAERGDIRDDIIRNIVVSGLTGSLLALLLVALLAGIVIRRGLAPLRALSTAISERGLDYLQPVRLPGPEPAELMPVTGALNHLLDRVHAGIDRERQFLADAAHELRTPLSVLKLQLQVAQQYTEPARLQASIDAVLLGVDRSIHAVEQLLTLARLEAADQGLNYSEVDVVELAREVLALLVPLALAQDQQLELGFDSEPLMCRANRVLLGILIRNLVDNALRHTPAGGLVEVRIGQQPDRVLLGVYDTGPGVPEEDMPRLSQRFYRPSQSADATGTGLGLSIVQRIVDLHRASLTLHNRDEGGLAVEVALATASGPRP